MNQITYIPGTQQITKICPEETALTTFHKGFNSFTVMVMHPGFITFRCRQHYDCCDDARKRINELKLPLTARVTGYNTFVVEEVKL